jgi:hypothetical protein
LFIEPLPFFSTSRVATALRQLQPLVDCDIGFHGSHLILDLDAMIDLGRPLDHYLKERFKCLI